MTIDLAPSLIKTGLPLIEVVLSGRKHLFRLPLGRHILMKNPYAAFFCKSYGHRGFRYGIHCSRSYRDIQIDVSLKLGLEGNLPRQYLGPSRNQKYVVKGKTFLLNSFLGKRHFANFHRQG